MLEELTEFSLEEADVHEDIEDDEDNSENSLISDLAFIYGFLHTSKLTNLTFSGRFWASDEMTGEWEETGGTIEYSDSE